MNSLNKIYHLHSFDTYLHANVTSQASWICRDAYKLHKLVVAALSPSGGVELRYTPWGQTGWDICPQSKLGKTLNDAAVIGGLPIWGQLICGSGAAALPGAPPSQAWHTYISLPLRGQLRPGHDSQDTVLKVLGLPSGYNMQRHKFPLPVWYCSISPPNNFTFLKVQTLNIYFSHSLELSISVLHRLRRGKKGLIKNATLEYLWVIKMDQVMLRSSKRDQKEYYCTPHLLYPKLTYVYALDIYFPHLQQLALQISVVRCMWVRYKQALE